MEKAQSVYTNKSISIATYFGGPLVAGFLAGHNFKVFGEKENQRFAIVTGIVSTLVVFELLFIIPDKIMNYVPHAFIPAIYTAIIYTLIQNTQESRINEYIAKGYKQASGWKAAGIGILFSLFIIGYIFLRSMSMPVFDGEKMTFGSSNHEIYYTEGISPDDVKKVGEELTKFGYFSTSETQIVQFTKYGDAYHLKIFVPKEWWEKEDIIESMKALDSRITAAIKKEKFEIIMVYDSLKGREEKAVY